VSSRTQAVLDAVRAERAIERGSRGKPWDDEAVWPVYLRAVEARRKAVDAWVREGPAEPEEAEPVSLALLP
jgi:hypothetical protein